MIHEHQGLEAAAKAGSGRTRGSSGQVVDSGVAPLMISLPLTLCLSDIGPRSGRTVSKSASTSMT